MGAVTKRCGWAEGSALMIAYHDREWGVPLHNDRKLFEYMVLDGSLSPWGCLSLSLCGVSLSICVCF